MDIEKILRRLKGSNANFVKRLIDPNRDYILDWKDPNFISTHKLSYVTNGDSAIVYPNIQLINNNLIDYTNPKYNFNKFDALQNAIKNGDTLHMSIPDAKNFTKEYKKYYPNFKYQYGGLITLDDIILRYLNGGHVVKPGDTLYKIARKNNLTLNEIILLNPQFKSNKNKTIYPGDIINIKNDSKEDDSNSRSLKVVKKGETLSSISRESGLSIDELLRYNPSIKSHPDLILEGQHINLSKPKNQLSEKLIVKETIKKNDTLSSIAKKNNISVQELVKQNPLFKKNPNLIFEGKEILIPKRRKYQPIKKEIKLKNYVLKNQDQNKPNKDSFDFNNWFKTSYILQLYHSFFQDKESKGKDKEKVNLSSKKTINKKDNTKDIKKSEEITPMGDTYYSDYIKSEKFDFSPVYIPKNLIYNGSPYHIDPKKCIRAHTNLCASYLTNESISPDGKTLNASYILKYNYRGNAWTWFMNAENKGYKPEINIYTEGDTFTGNESKNEVILKTRNIAKTDDYKKRVSKALKPGSVVTLLYPWSNHFELALKESNGTMLSTHIGDVISREGKLFVRDNVGGIVHERPVNDVINNKTYDGVLITGVLNYPTSGYSYANMSNYGYGYNPQVMRKDRLSSSGVFRAVEALNKNKDSLLKEGISNEEFELYKSLVPALVLQESNGGTGTNYLKDAKGDGPKKWADALSYSFLKNGVDLGLFESKGLTNIKYLGDRGDNKSLFTIKELEDFGITEDAYKNPKMMETPEVTGVMTALALHKKSNELKDILKDLPPSIKDDKELFNSLLLVSWNLGTKNIRKNVDFYKENQNPEELLLYKKSSYVNNIQRGMSYMPYQESSNVLNKLLSGIVTLNRLTLSQIENILKELFNLLFLKEKRLITGKLNTETQDAIKLYLDIHKNQLLDSDKKFYKEKYDRLNNLLTSSLPRIENKEFSKNGIKNTLYVKTPEIIY